MGFESVGGMAVIATTGFTRPANTTAYVAGQLVAQSTTAGSVVPLAFGIARVSGYTFLVRRARIKKTTNVLTAASFRLHLYRGTPTVANGDGGVWLSSMSGYMGSVDVTCDKAFTDGAAGIGVPVAGSEINGDTNGGSISVQALLEARDAYAPGSGEVFTVELEVWQN